MKKLTHEGHPFLAGAGAHCLSDWPRYRLPEGKNGDCWAEWLIPRFVCVGSERFSSAKRLTPQG